MPKTGIRVTMYVHWATLRSRGKRNPLRDCD